MLCWLSKPFSLPTHPLQLPLPRLLLQIIRKSRQQPELRPSRQAMAGRLAQSRRVCVTLTQALQKQTLAWVFQLLLVSYNLLSFTQRITVGQKLPSSHYNKQYCQASSLYLACAVYPHTVSLKA